MRIDSVAWRAPTVSCSITPDSAIATRKSNSAFDSRLNSAAGLLAAFSAEPEYSSRSLAASFGSKSSAVTCPISSILFSSFVVTPSASAAIRNAPGKRSPNCCLNSSACTLPFDTICSSARNAPATPSVERFSTRAASDIAVKISRVFSPSSAVPRVAAENLANMPDMDSIDRPSRSASLRIKFRESVAPAAVPVTAASAFCQPIIWFVLSMMDLVKDTIAPTPMAPANAPTA